MKKIQQIDWNGREINITGELLHHLGYADDIGVFANSKEELTRDIKAASERVGLEIKRQKDQIHDKPRGHYRSGNNIMKYSKR